MCRFLVACGPRPFEPHPLLSAFAQMAETSRSPDGDRQADGCGVAWLDGDNTWQRIRSLAPIWQAHDAFAHAPASRAIALHARSASFPADRGYIEHNQPYLVGRHACVFNGLLTGVALPGRPGTVGAQRIATLLGALLARHDAYRALPRLFAVLRARSRAIPACNLAICDSDGCAALCHFEDHPDYYQLHEAERDGARIVCSEPLPGMGWRPLPRTPR